MRTLKDLLKRLLCWALLLALLVLAAALGAAVLGRKGLPQVSCGQHVPRCRKDPPCDG